MRCTLILGLFALVTVYGQRPVQPNFPQHSTGLPGNILPPLPDNHATRLGATISGRPLQLGAPGPVRPWVPIYVGGYGLGPQQPVYYPPMMPVTNHVTVVQTPPPAPLLSVNPDYVGDTTKPSMREYYTESKPYADMADEKKKVQESRSAAPSTPSSSSVTLIALKDGTLVQAVAYWFEGDTLHYVRPDHRMEKVLLAQVDRDSSRRFNEERGLTFRMPE